MPEPVNLYSSHGVLIVNLSYNTAVDSAGGTLYCFTTPDGTESPTLHVNPGDNLIVNVTNKLPAPTSTSSMTMVTNAAKVCGAPMMDSSSVNVHYHGTNTAPTCHSDEVIFTLINSGQSFTYNVHIPADEPSGLYWYHPHVHGQSETAVQGGASGAIIVDGIQDTQPAVANLPERVFLIRDQQIPESEDNGGNNEPGWDLSVNYVQVLYPRYTPAVLNMRPGEKQFWRVVNAAADTILNLQLVYDGIPQTLVIAALDGVPTGSQTGAPGANLISKNDILLPPGARAEFIVTGPSASVRNAILQTLNIPTGPDGDNDPMRPLFAIKVSPQAAEPVHSIPPVSALAAPQRFSSIPTALPSIQRILYFSEDNPQSRFFITVDGAKPALFDPNAPPAITTTQGSVEDWIVQNRTLENHEFHIHLIHFLLLERNGVPVSAQDRQMLDMIDVPHWSGKGPYPSVKLRMDFRGSDIGDFVYHCHILEHEDLGMMQIIRVQPAPSPSHR